jgi:hypothetical protein
LPNHGSTGMGFKSFFKGDDENWQQCWSWHQMQESTKSRHC